MPTMLERHIRITSVPPGGAPIWVRQEWLGLILPVTGRHEGRLADVVTHREIHRRSGGWAVEWIDAMTALEQKSAEALGWWDENVMPTQLIFSDDCCEIVPE